MLFYAALFALQSAVLTSLGTLVGAVKQTPHTSIRFLGNLFL